MPHAAVVAIMSSKNIFKKNPENDYSNICNTFLMNYSFILKISCINITAQFKSDTPEHLSEAYCYKSVWHVAPQRSKSSFHMSTDPARVCAFPCVYVTVSLCPFSAGAPAGEAQGDVQEDAGSAAARREVPPPHRPRAGHGEAQARGLHEQERRLHQPPGAGERKVRRRGAWNCHTTETRGQSPCIRLNSKHMTFLSKNNSTCNM